MEDLETLLKLRTHDILYDFFKQRTGPGVPEFRHQETRPDIFEARDIQRAEKRRRNLEAGFMVGLANAGYNQHLQNQPLKQFYERSRKPVGKIELRREAFKPTRYTPPATPILSSKPSHVLPVLDGNKLMRRPTDGLSEPLVESDEFFQYLASFPDLKPYNFEDNAIKTLEFYLKKFPLILRVPSTQETATLVVNRRRVRSPEVLIQRHRVSIAAKQREMEVKIRELELDSEEEFVTQLKSNVFEPQSWPWNEGLFNSRPGSKLSRPTSKLSRGSSSRPSSKQSRPNSKLTSYLP